MQPGRLLTLVANTPTAVSLADTVRRVDVYAGAAVAVGWAPNDDPTGAVTFNDAARQLVNLLRPTQAEALVLTASADCSVWLAFGGSPPSAR